MGTWEWDCHRRRCRWSENLEQIHGLPPGTFDGTFESYEREIHPDDRDRVFASLRRAIEEGVPHDVEYRIVAPRRPGAVGRRQGARRVRERPPVRMAGVCMMVSRRKEAELARLSPPPKRRAGSRTSSWRLSRTSCARRSTRSSAGCRCCRATSCSAEKARHAIDVIGRNAKLQAQLIEDILDVSRIITGKLDIDRRPLLVPQLVDNVLSAPAAGRRRETDSAVPRRSRRSPGDRRGPEASPAGARQHRVERHQVHAGARAGLTSLAASTRAGGDSGARLGRRHRRRLPSVRLRSLPPGRQPAGSRCTAASGSGLAIARHLLELHGGRISALSDGARPAAPHSRSGCPRSRSPGCTTAAVQARNTPAAATV